MWPCGRELWSGSFYRQAINSFRIAKPMVKCWIDISNAQTFGYKQLCLMFSRIRAKFCKALSTNEQNYDAKVSAAGKFHCSASQAKFYKALSKNEQNSIFFSKWAWSFKSFVLGHLSNHEQRFPEAPSKSEKIFVYIFCSDFAQKWFLASGIEILCLLKFSRFRKNSLKRLPQIPYV